MLFGWLGEDIDDGYESICWKNPKSSSNGRLC